jgi:hypothetical protein
MSLAGLHLQLTKPDRVEPTPEKLELSSLKYYIDRVKYLESVRYFVAGVKEDHGDR